MGLDYSPLWKLLIDKNMNKTDLINVGLTAPTIAKMGRNEPVSLTTVDKICEYFDCEISDVVIRKKKERE